MQFKINIEYSLFTIFEDTVHLPDHYQSMVVLSGSLIQSSLFSLKCSYIILIFFQYFYLRNSKIPKTDQSSVK